MRHVLTPRTKQRMPYPRLTPSRPRRALREIGIYKVAQMERVFVSIWV